MANHSVHALSKDKLDKNYVAGVVLTIVSMLTCLFIYLTGEISSLFFSTALIDLMVTKNYSLNFILSAVFTIALIVIVFAPLCLNIKGWYQEIDKNIVHIRRAFSFFAKMESYCKALYFVSIRSIALFLVFFISFIPTLILTGVLRYGLKLTKIPASEAYGLIAIITVILFILGFVFGLYYSISFFYTDYIFVKNITHNPFKALILSRKLAKRNSKSLLYMLINMSIYYLACIPIITIPLVVPKIQATFTAYSDEILNTYLEEQKCQF